MAAQTTTVEMTGGGPWGFRLFGGEDDPLIVAKLRKRSKAHDAGLQEDDVLLAINSYTCRGMSHSNAMGLSDKGDSLKLTVLRGTSDKNAVDAAFQNLGPEIKPLPVSELPQSASTLQVEPSPRGRSTSPRASPNVWKTREARFGGGIDEPTGHVKREERSFTEGNKEKHVTTETSTQKFGGTTLTKITREEVSRTKFGSEPVLEPISDSKPVFQVSKIGGAKPLKPNAWSPAASSTPAKPVGFNVRAPGDVRVQQHPDQSVTMTIGIHKPDEEGKENVSPSHQPPMFKVPKISQQHDSPTAWKPSTLKQQQPAFPLARPDRFSPQPEMELIPDGSGRWGRHGGVDKMDGMEPEDHPKEPPMKPNNFTRNNAPIPLMLTKILHEGFGSGSDDCSTPDTPTRRKKLFGDSAFYDDPEHKYPTIEEQIKMARKVALSLTAPANVQARGHRMFVRRQKKAVKWTTGEELADMVDMMFDDDEEVYGHPDPWKIKWEPPKVTAPVRKMEIPNPPPLPTGVAWRAPNIPHVGVEKSKALSADEFERMRLYDAKAEHTTIGPQACFALADALKHSKGKAGRLFAKRKERAEKWVVDEENVQSPSKPPDADMIRKLTGGRSVGMPMPNAAAPSTRSGPPVNRLKEMIELPKAAMTPWEAAIDNPEGNLEKAFSHLDGYFAAKSKARAADSLQGMVPQAKPDLFTPSAASATGSLSPASTVSSGPPRMPDYTRKIKPWGSQGADAASPAGASSSPQSWSGHESSAAPSRPAASWSQQPQASSPSSHHQGDTNFRPVKFQPAPGVTRTGSWQPSSGAAPAASPIPAGGEASAGICDL